MEDTVRVRCPYCREWVDLYIDPDTTGALVEDCAVCCRPWAITVERDGQTWLLVGPVSVATLEQDAASLP